MKENIQGHSVWRLDTCRLDLVLGGGDHAILLVVSDVNSHSMLRTHVFKGSVIDARTVSVVLDEVIAAKKSRPAMVCWNCYLDGDFSLPSWLAARGIAFPVSVMRPKEKGWVEHQFEKKKWRKRCLDATADRQ